MIGRRKALLTTYLSVFFWRAERFVLALAAWRKGRQNEACSPAKPTTMAMGPLQPHGQCTAHLPMPGPGREAGHSNQTRGPAQAVGVSALGTGGVKGQRSALSGDRECVPGRGGVEWSLVPHGRSFTRQMGFWGWVCGRDF